MGDCAQVTEEEQQTETRGPDAEGRRRFHGRGLQTTQKPPGNREERCQESPHRGKVSYIPLNKMYFMFVQK